MPGNRTSGSTTCESVGQNSGLSFHSVPDSSKHAPLRISQSLPFDLTIVEHLGHRVCIFILSQRRIEPRRWYQRRGSLPVLDSLGGCARA
jgi:hypothetical protein